MILATPCHNCGIGGKTTLQNLIPTDNLATLLVEELLGIADEIALQILLGSVLLVALYAQLLDASLTLGTLLPTGLGALVATDVDVLRGENLHNLGQHVLDETQSGIVAGTENLVGNAPHGPHVIRTTGATQFGISMQGTHHVTGHVYLGDDGDVALGSILDQLLGLLLGVETAIGDTIVLS